MHSLTDSVRQTGIAWHWAACMKKILGTQAVMRAAEEEQRQVIAKHGQELSLEALNDMKVRSTATS